MIDVDMNMSITKYNMIPGGYCFAANIFKPLSHCICFKDVFQLIHNVYVLTWII